MIPLFPAPDRPPPTPRRWMPRCDDCKRRIWSADALRRRFGLLLGDKCHRKRVRAQRRRTSRFTFRIPVRRPGRIPGQLTIPLPERKDRKSNV